MATAVGAVRPKRLGPVLVATAAATAGLLVLAAIASLTDLPLFALPFAASAAIVALAPASPFARPRSIVVSHVLGAAVALAAVALLGPSVWTAALAAGLVTAPMLLLGVAHPPATATAALVGLTAPEPLFLVSPVLVASVVVVATGVVVGRCRRGYDARTAAASRSAAPGVVAR